MTVTALSLGVLPGARGAAAHNARALQAAIDYCAARGAVLDLGSGTIFVDGRLTIDRALAIAGRGAGEWSKFPAYVSTGGKSAAPTQLVFTGAGARDIALYGVTSMQASGAAWPNPSARAGLNESVYRMQSFSHGDGGAPRLQPFSAAIHIRGAGAAGTVLRGFRIIPDHGGDDGLAGYLDVEAGWSAGDYDCGVYQDGSERVLYDCIHRVGHWRRSGYLLSCVGNDPHGYRYGWQPPYYTRHVACVDEGWKSVSIRGTDSFQIVNVGAGYIETPWADDHPFVAGLTGYDSIRVGRHFLSADVLPLVSAPKVVIAGEARVRLNTGTALPEIAVGDSAHPRTVGGGSSHVHFVDCTQHGMIHPSGYECHDAAIANPYAAPDTPIEISGWRMVEIVFDRNAIQCRSQVAMHMHEVTKIQVRGFIEKNPSRSAGSSSAYRVIAAPDRNRNPNVARGRAAGATRMLDMDIMDAIQSIPGMDARPYVYIPEHRRGEFSTAGETGMFRPQWGVLEQALRMSGMEEGHILRAPAGRRVGFAGSEFVSSPDGAGYLDMRFWYDDATRTVCTNAALVPNHSALDVGSAEVPFRRGWFGTVIMGGPYAGDAEAAIAKLNATIADLQAIVSEIMDATTKPQRSPYRGAGKNLTDIVYDATINKGWLTEAAAAKLFTWPGSPTSIGPAMARLVREGRAERRKAEGKKMEWRMISASQ